jgi:hypothetical protein
MKYLQLRNTAFHADPLPRMVPRLIWYFLKLFKLFYISVKVFKTEISPIFRFVGWDTWPAMIRKSMISAVHPEEDR